MSEAIKVYRIGLDGTEVYAGHSEEEVKQFYRNECGTEDYCESDLRDDFVEITDIDTVFIFDDEWQKIRTTWRKIAEAANLPAQIATGYN